MNKYLTNPRTIEKLVEKPNDILNKQTLSKDEQNSFKQGLSSIIFMNSLEIFIVSRSFNIVTRKDLWIFTFLSR